MENTILWRITKEELEQEVKALREMNILEDEEILFAEKAFLFTPKNPQKMKKGWVKERDLLIGGDGIVLYTNKHIIYPNLFFYERRLPHSRGARIFKKTDILSMETAYDKRSEYGAQVKFTFADGTALVDMFLCVDEESKDLFEKYSSLIKTLIDQME